MSSDEIEQREKKPQREIITAPLYFDRYVASELRALEQNIVSLKESVDERFTDLERSIDERFARVDRCIDELEKRIASFK